MLDVLIGIRPANFIRARSHEGCFVEAGHMACTRPPVQIVIKDPLQCGEHPHMTPFDVDRLCLHQFMIRAEPANASMAPAHVGQGGVTWNFHQIIGRTAMGVRDDSVCVEGSRGEAISARSCSASRVQSCVRPINAAALTAGLEGFRQDHAPDRLDGLRRPTR